jgi:D-beta-D-heptose 7-phosphate kinase / D-beta-D-heptose 1-phosphate adenosyltransferase
MDELAINTDLFNDLHILVFGDVMLDRYWYGHVNRISPEAPVPIVSVADMHAKPGGAANVAMNIKALGANVSLFGYVGEDDKASTLKELLTQADITCFLTPLKNIPTTTKLRVLGKGQQLLRMDFEKPQSHTINENLIKQYTEQLASANVVVLSDYAKGACQDIQQLIQLAKKQHKIILVDPKHGDYARYRGATLLAPNRREFEEVVGVCENQDELVAKAKKLMKDYDIKVLCITLGQEGMLLVPAKEKPLYLKAKAQEVFDVTGAGDTVVAVFAAAMAAGLDNYAAARLANTAAGIAVSKLGAAQVTVAELQLALQRDYFAKQYIVQQEELLQRVAEARSRGEKIVMTNGCFDILHAGHIEYLQQARQLGQCLIVAVNSDESTKRLKGKNRPINSLAMRMQVLAALRAVDWVVSFDADTPAELINQVKPDVLVKGGDYQLVDIAGSDVVLASGGQIITLDIKEGYSTSALIDRIRQGLS